MDDRQELAELEELELLEQRAGAGAPMAPASEPPPAQPDRAPITAESLGQSLTNALPMMGGAIGGGLGMLAGPAGAMVGGGAGYALGKGAQAMIDQYAFDKPSEALGIPGRALRTAQDMATGAAIQGGGGMLGQAANAVSKALPATQISTTIGKPSVDFLAGLLPRSLDKIASRAGNAIVNSNAPLAVDEAVGIATSTLNKLPQFYQTILYQASSQGPRKAAITHFLMGQQDPKYQQALRDAEQE